MTVSASLNGGYYICDPDLLVSDNVCIFAYSGSQPDDWPDEVVSHDIDRDVGANFCRAVATYEGVLLSVSPKPWQNGDVLVGTTEPVTGDLWSSYALIFELIAPLRDMMMYNPEPLYDPETWAMYTRALTDCNQKTVDYNRAGGSPFSTSQVYEYLLNPGGTDIHHFILQYLEEGTFDLLCLSSEIDDDHCDATRVLAGSVLGQRCNCWFDAYEALYGECPAVDMDFEHCALTTAPSVCANVAKVDTSDVVCSTDTEPEAPEEPEEPEVPSPPEPPSPPSGKPSGKPTGRR